MSLSWPSWATFGNTILAYPRGIVPMAPDFMNCDERYAKELDPQDCKFAIAAMPSSQEGVEVEWAVNQKVAQYSLPMTIVNSRDKDGTCSSSIGTSIDLALIHPPFA